jgi:pyruvate, orthophosphate dikinase
MRVFRFAKGAAQGSADLKDLLGGKGANLAEMCRLGLPVPPGFTLPTTISRHLLENGELPPELPALVDEGLAHIEAAMNRRFGAGDEPLLLSVRSGAPASMPGMMETVLNIGLTLKSAEAWAARSKTPTAVWDAYRRFLQMYGDVVLGIGDDDDKSPFERVLEDKRQARGVRDDSSLTTSDLEEVARRFLVIVEEYLGGPFGEDPREHLRGSIEAVFKSWNAPRAVAYRELHDLPHEMGTACNVQAMVFGDKDERSGTGVVFTRDPATGEPATFGEFLVRAQGEDVVAGIRTPDALHKRQKDARPGRSFEEEMPPLYEELREILTRLEQHFTDLQDVEFTVQSGTLWILQTRKGKRSARAAVRVAVDMVKEGLIDERTAVARVEPSSVTQVLLPALDDKTRERALAAGARLGTGLPASPGVGVGVVVFTVDEALRRVEAGDDVILVRPETSAEDIRGMHAAKAIVTARGGMTSHAAVVARGMGRPCVAGCDELEVDLRQRKARFGGRELAEGDTLTIDGTHGEVFAGALETSAPAVEGELEELLRFADKFRRLQVRANADLPEDARRAREFGAEGVGLCRTEHMFFGEDRLLVMRQLILADSEEERRAPLEKLLTMQRQDFEALLKEMSGLPVTIRLLDPPLHEFLPTNDEESAQLARELALPRERVIAAVEHHREQNPMLGLRGCRLALVHPDIPAMQTRAALEGAFAAKRGGAVVKLELMVPLVAGVEELVGVKEVITRTAREVFKEQGEELPFLIGTMIELPRAALLAGRIASEAAFFSFGTNDLTQTTYGLSRDDAGRFLPLYKRTRIFPHDPFETLDEEGVGELVRLATERGRATRGDLEVGICGEHGGDPASIALCERLGLDYVSCSPWRVPVARLAAAQATFR